MNKNYIGMDKSVEQVISDFFALLFPAFFGSPDQTMTTSTFNHSLEQLLSFTIEQKNQSEVIAAKLTQRLSNIKQLIDTDIQAAYQGDPAAKSTDEIILTYPGFKAISIHRLAHELYLLDVPIVPRMLSENMHSLTGIDIHPGAQIGAYFFIDHGTGIVIGETTVIGEHVRIYQNVTLGVRNFNIMEDGSLAKYGKRHPNIGDGVVIYAGATILGGDTFIGDNTVIGSGTWITRSVPENTVVVNKNSTY